MVNSDGEWKPRAVPPKRSSLIGRVEENFGRYDSHYLVDYPRFWSVIPPPFLHMSNIVGIVKDSKKVCDFSSDLQIP